MPNIIGKLYEKATQASLKQLFYAGILGRESDLNRLTRFWSNFWKYLAEFCHI